MNMKMNMYVQICVCMFALYAEMRKSTCVDDNEKN